MYVTKKGNKIEILFGAAKIEQILFKKCYKLLKKLEKAAGEFHGLENCLSTIDKKGNNSGTITMDFTA